MRTPHHSACGRVNRVELPTKGPGHGEFPPATKLRLNEQGAIVSEGYNADMVPLSNVVGK